TLFGPGRYSGDHPRPPHGGCAGLQSARWWLGDAVMNRRQSDAELLEPVAVSANGNVSPDSESPAAPAPRRRYRRRIVLAFGVVAAVVLLTFGVRYVLYARAHESTDDAFIDGHIVGVSPKVASYVARVFVDDNTHVKAGDLLVELEAGPRGGDERQGRGRPRRRAEGAAGGRRYPAPARGAARAGARTARERAGCSRSDRADPGPGRSARGPDRPVRGGRPPGRAGSFVYQAVRARDGARHAQERRARRVRPGRPDAVLDRARPRVGGGQLQGDPAPPHATGATRDRQGRRVSRSALPGACRQHPGRQRRALQPVAARERDGQLRESRSAGAGQDRHRRGAGSPARPGPRHVGGARGAGAMKATMRVIAILAARPGTGP